MKFSREQIEALAEAPLRQLTLIPLFRAMGFQDVRENHGTSEKGKDIVMWKHSDLDSRIDYAVVVKATKIFALTEAGHHDMPKEIFGNVLLLENEIIRRGSLLLRHVEGKRPP